MQRFAVFRRRTPGVMMTSSSPKVADDADAPPFWRTNDGDVKRTMTTKRATAFEDATRAKMRRKPPPPSSLRSRRRRRRRFPRPPPRRRVLSRIIIILLFTRHQIATTTQTSKTPPFSRSGEKDIFQSTIVRSRHIIKTRARALLRCCWWRVLVLVRRTRLLLFSGGGGLAF